MKILNHPVACSRLIGILVLVYGISAAAQEQARKTPPVQTTADVDGERSTPPGYGQLHRDFGFAGAVRAWERGMYLNPQTTRARDGFGSYYPYYGGYGTYYGSRSPALSNRLYRESYDDGYQAFSLQLNHAYALGVAPAEIQERLAGQAAHALFEFQDVMQAGHQAFARGDYDEAARNFLLATQLNQGDPGSRLCAAHAEVAVGHYERAAALVHRAFDLQPKLAYLSPDMRGAYGKADDFEGHLDGLRRVTQASTNAELWFLLGYYCYGTRDSGEAADALRRAHQLDPGDRIIADFAAAVGPQLKFRS